MASRPLIAIVATLLLAPLAAAADGPSRLATMSELAVNERVDGDVVAIGGDVVLGPSADVSGHAVSIFGKVHVQPGARIGGRVIAVDSLASLTVDRVRASEGRHADLGLRFLVAGGWLLATTLIAFLWPGFVRRGAAAVPELGLRAVILGVMVALTLVAALVAVLGLGPSMGVPLAITIAVAFTAGKAVGLAILGAAVGAAVLRRLVPGRLFPATAIVFVGVGAMLAVRFIPVVGGAAWTLLVVLALGAAVVALTMATDHPSAESSHAPTGSGH
jgi:hypothetical protein